MPSCNQTCFRAGLGEYDALYHARKEVARLKKENKKLHDALAPFGCLGRNELTQGDFNKARRALATSMGKDAK